MRATSLFCMQLPRAEVPFLLHLCVWGSSSTSYSHHLTLNSPSDWKKHDCDPHTDIISRSQTWSHFHRFTGSFVLFTEYLITAIWSPHYVGDIMKKTYQDYAAIIWNYPLKRGDLIWTQSKFNDADFRTLCATFFSGLLNVSSLWKKLTVFYTLPTRTPRNRPYSSSNIKAARLPARPHTVEYSSLLRRRPTSAKPRIPLIFHGTSSFLSWHSRKRSGSIRLVGLSSATFSRCGAESHRDPFRCLQECVLLPDSKAFILYI